MGRIEYQRRPQLGRLQDFESRRQFAIEWGHYRAPSLSSAAGTVDSSGKGSFYGHALSVIATILPSEKAGSGASSAWNASQEGKSPSPLISAAFPSTNGLANGPRVLARFHRKFTRRQAY
jgi:hypothetical protein